MDEHNHHEAHGHEETDVRSRPLMLFFVAFLALCGVGFVVAKWSYDALVKFENARQNEKLTLVTEKKAEIPESLTLRTGGPEVTTIPATGSLLQPDPVRDMSEMRTAQLGKLNSYGWIDRDKGIVHVPIEKAMALAIERSMVRAQAPEPATAATQAPSAPATQPAAAPATR
ncbi:MAG: hypothetical protein WC538_10785 [Thermoanaerobaculia bacterium]|jgi:hypothetical protein